MRTKQEIWNNIKGYEGLYEVSNCGRVKSIKRNTTNGGILKLGYTNDGYNQVCLYNNGKKKSYRVCRIVAIAFIDNEKNELEVNHIDKNVKNDCVENLEWCNRQYNVDYSRSIPVIRCKDGEVVSYNSINSAEKDGYYYTQIKRSLDIGWVYNGYVWKYA